MKKRSLVLLCSFSGLVSIGVAAATVWQTQQPAGQLLTPYIAPDQCPLPALKAGVADNRQDPFFSHDHPVRGCLQKLHNANGKTLTPFPFQGYAGNTNMLGGTVDYSALADIMQGSGYHPMKTVVNGQDKGFLYVYYNELTDTTVGDYSEMLTFIPAAKDGSAAPFENFKYANAMSPLAAMFTYPAGTVFYFWKVYLNNQDAIDYGRQLMGFDKYKARLDLNDAEASTRVFDAWDPQGKPLFHAEMTEKDADIGPSVPLVVEALKVNGLEFQAPPPVQSWPLVSRLPGGPMVSTNFVNRQTLKFKVFGPDDSFKLSCKSELGRTLLGMHFEPTVLAWSRDMVASLEWWSSDARVTVPANAQK